MWSAVDLVKSSALSVVNESQHVEIQDENIQKYANELVAEWTNGDSFEDTVVDWNDGDVHYNQDAGEGGALTCQYIFLVDALNFCFWPTPGMEYEHLAIGLKKAVELDIGVLDANRWVNMDKEQLALWFAPYTPNQLEERVAKVRELGHVLVTQFEGLGMNMVKAANHSAVKLVDLITMHIRGFQDHSVYRGKQVYFYKRAQILVGDLWGAYGRSIDKRQTVSFHDIDQLTMFADYRVPQILVAKGILTYSEELQQMVNLHKTIPSGDEKEIEIRAATIIAVQRLQGAIHLLYDNPPTVIQLDWLLWQLGEKLKQQICPHHRTLSVFY